MQLGHAGRRLGLPRRALAFVDASERRRVSPSDARSGRAASVSRLLGSRPLRWQRDSAAKLITRRLLPRAEEHSEVACRRIAGHGGSVKLLPPRPRRAQQRGDGTRTPRAALGRLGRLASPTPAPPALKNSARRGPGSASAARPWRVHWSARWWTCALRDAPRDRLRMQAFRAHRGATCRIPTHPVLPW
jgi:hypothetical protein